jgi:NTE family protein
VVLKTFPQACLNPLPAWTAAADDVSASVAADLLTTTARAVRRYRDPLRMQYVKLADGGLTDNQGLASILVARAVSGNAYGPLQEADAVRMRRMLFLIVDAGRPPTGDWAMTRDGPSGLDVAIAAADAAIDSATRLSAVAFRTMFDDWRQSIVQHRCSLSMQQVRRWLPAGEPWDCADVRFYIDVIGFERLAPARAERLRQMPTRLALTAADIEAAVSAGRDAALASPALARYLAERVPRDGH